MDAGASGTNPARTELTRMLDLACSAERPFDAIVVHSYSRLYRDLIGMETAAKRLQKSGVDLISATQPSGTDPTQQLVRQIVALFDQHTLVENAKNVTPEPHNDICGGQAEVALAKLASARLLQMLNGSPFTVDFRREVTRVFH